MPILSETQRDNLASEYGDRAAVASLHNGNPGTTGLNEINGDGYSREALTWSAPSSSQVQASVSFDVPATTITHVGLWDAGESVLLDVYELGAPVTVSQPGQRNFTLTWTQT